MNNLTCIIKNQYRTEILDKIIVYVMEMISKKHWTEFKHIAQI